MKTGEKFNDLVYTLFYGFANIAMKLVQYTKKPAIQNCMFASN